MTDGGGTHGCGVVFSIDSNGGNYKVLLNFDTINGSYPLGNLTIVGSKLYGIANWGGAHDSGCIFSIDTDGSMYKDLFDFNTADGAFPGSISLTLIGGMLYGTAGNGGANNSGVIFSIDTNGTSYTDLYNFDVTTGEYPNGVVNDGKMLYGMATWGGPNNGGVIYKFKEAGLGINNLISGVGSITAYPNPSAGIFTLTCHYEQSEESLPVIKVYNILGQQVLTETLHSAQGDNTVDMSNQPNGIYLYRVMNEDGTLIGEGKVVVQK